MKLIIPYQLADRIEPHLPAVGEDIQVVRFDLDGSSDGDIIDGEVLFRWWTPTPVLRQMVAYATRLRWLHTPSAGVDHLLIPEVLARNIVLTNSVGAHAVPIAEFVLLFMLSRAKRLHELVALTPHNAWEQGDQMELDELDGRTLLIVGLGHIGREIARRATAFGVRVLASRRHPQPTDGIELVVGEDGWRDLLLQADYVVIATPLTNATRGMFDAEVLARMKPDAYLINIARGEIIDTAALLEVLHQGRIAGAALDALPEEPLPAEHPLWQAPNVWITPHISWSSPRVQDRTIDIFIENLRRYRSGQPLMNVVDKVAGY